ncbi:MAG: hypothetical protein AMJ94_05340 [Deltaproteobacteria bacterium SM23_61]|nr:MAG: hypothetical protein AMJ94_05340 [Deltaproteobacteria bacterium SM23_61]
MVRDSPLTNHPNFTFWITEKISHGKVKTRGPDADVESNIRSPYWAGQQQKAYNKDSLFHVFTSFRKYSTFHAHENVDLSFKYQKSY